MSTWVYRMVLAFIFAAIFYWLYPNTEANPRPDIWDLRQDNGQISVLGLTIGKTKLHEAMQTLKSMPDIAMFTQKHKRNEAEPDKQLEAFFDKLFDQNDSIILGLGAEQKLLERIKKDAYKPEIFPNGVIRVGVDESLYGYIEALPIASITVLAGQQIDVEDFQNKFGKPDKLLNDGQGNAHFLYPKLGLDLIQPAGGTQILQLVDPAMFDEKLLQPLLQLKNKESKS